MNKKNRYLMKELKDYIKETPMTKKERKLLKKWVKSGNSVYESPGSKYLMDSYPPKDFLETYREDMQIKADIKGMNKKQTRKYLMEYMGITEDTAYKVTKKDIEDHINKSEHELFFLWEYIYSEGLYEDVKEYLEEHKDDDISFKFPYNICHTE